MKENELRVGNLVLIDSDIWGAVSEIRSNHAKVLYKGEVNGEVSERISLIEFIRLSPIPLTEEWLLKFEFIKTYENPFIEYEWSLGEFQISNEFESYLGKYGDVIKSVHQLQNLYFALTGEELKINSLNNLHH